MGDGGRIRCLFLYNSDSSDEETRSPTRGWANERQRQNLPEHSGLHVCAEGMADMGRAKVTRVLFDMPAILICGQNLRYPQFLLKCQMILRYPKTLLFLAIIVIYFSHAAYLFL